jgi:putative ABC transport system permease protein
VWAIDPRLPVREIITGRDLINRSASRSRFNLALLATFALSGLLLAAVGVYGVMTLFVGQRQREMGLRIALGATPAAVAVMVLRQTATVLTLGVAIGSLGALGLARFITSLLFDTVPTDAVSFGTAIAAIVVSASLATLLPVLRATRVDPAVVLRGE